MNNKEKQLLSKLLSDASNEFSIHGCNDIPEQYFKNWTDEEKKEFNDKLHDFNNTQDAEEREDIIYYSDWLLFSYFSHLFGKSEKQVKNESNIYKHWD